MQSSLLYIVISTPQQDRRMSGGVKVYDVQSRRSVGQINSRNCRNPSHPNNGAEDHHSYTINTAPQPSRPLLYA